MKKSDVKILISGLIAFLFLDSHVQAQISCPACAAGDVTITIASGATYNTAIAPGAGKNICITGPSSGTPATLSSTFTFNGTNTVCFSGLINMTSNFSGVGFGNTPKFIFQAGSVINHSGTFDINGGYGNKSYVYNYGTYTNTNSSPFLLKGTELYNSGTFTVQTAEVDISSNGNVLNHVNTSTGTITIGGVLDINWGSGSDSFLNQGSMTAQCFYGHSSSGVFSNPTGSTLTFTGTDGGCHALQSNINSTFDVGVTMFASNGTFNVKNGTATFNASSNATDLSGAKLYVQNFTSASHIFNTTPGCMSILVTGLVTINSGNTYSGNIFIYDQSFTSTSTANGDTYAGNTLGCVVNGGGGTGCPTINNTWNSLQNLASNKVIYSSSDNGTTFGCPKLPVVFTKFDAIQTDNGNQLTWTTTEEDNAQLFNIERSFDGRNFEIVGKVNAHGNSSLSNSYQFFDIYESHEVVYYRLKEVDKDGVSMYSNMISVQIKGDVNAILLSNPVKDEIKLQLLSEDDNTISIVNTQGSVLFEKLYSGTQLVTIKSQFSPGLYFVRISNQNQVSFLKCIIE